MRYLFLLLLLFGFLKADAKSYLKIELDNAHHIIIFDGALYSANTKFEGEMDGGKHAISILKHDYNLTTSKVKTEILYEGTLDLSDNMFYTYKLSGGYLSFVSVDVYTPASNAISTSGNTGTSANTATTTGTAMDAATFPTFLTKVKDKVSDTQKTDFVKSTMKNNWFSTDQVKEILQTLNFESNKVDLAKLIWHKTTDKESYFKIYDVFTFSSSEKSVQEYIDSQN